MNKILMLNLTFFLMFTGVWDSFSSDQEQYEFVAKWGTYGSGNSQFNGPSGIAVDSSGIYLFVADRFNNRVQRFTVNGMYSNEWGDFGRANGKFNETTSVATSKFGDILVVDRSNHRVQKFSFDDTTVMFIDKWGSYGSAESEFMGPESVAVDAEGNVYVADTLNHRIQKFDNNGGFITEWGSYGTGNEEFNEPRGIAIDTSGYIYVSDMSNNRIQKFGSVPGEVTPTFVTTWGTKGSGDGQLVEPRGISTDKLDSVYVADWGNHRIQKFTSRGEFITKWGSHGRGNGQFRNPSDVALDTAGNVYVADFMNDRIQKFRLSDKPADTECLSIVPSFAEADRQKTERVDVVITTEGIDVSKAIVAFDCDDILINTKSISADKKSITVEFIIWPEAESCAGNVLLSLPEEDIELDCGEFEIKRPARCVEINPESVRVEGKEPHIEEVTISFEDAEFEYANVSFACPDVMVSRRDILEQGLIVDFIIWPEADNCTQPVLISLPGGVELDCDSFQIIKEDGPQPCLFSFLLEDDEYDLELLARFRDETLSRSKHGRALIGYYYRFSDDAVSVMERNNALKHSAKFLLKPVIHVIDYLYQ